MKRRLLVIVDHPLLSVAALDNRPEELLSLAARDVPGGADDSFNPKFLLLLTHIITEIFGNVIGSEVWIGRPGSCFYRFVACSCVVVKGLLQVSDRRWSKQLSQDASAT